MSDWLAAAEELAVGFAARATQHDESAELPLRNLQELHAAGLDTAWLVDGCWQEFGAVLAVMSRACPSTATVWLMHVGSAYGLISMSDAANSAFFTEELRAGKRFATALSEPSGGNLFLNPLQEAEPRPGGYSLNGAKRFVSGAEIADYLLVNALVDGNPGFFAMRPDDTVETVPIWDSMGLRATRSQLLIFRDSLLRAELRCTRPGPHRANPIPVGLAYLSLGIAEAALAALVAHARGRKIPGQGLLADMQWVRFAAADAHVRLRSARLLADDVAGLANRGSPQVNEAAMEAKYLANEVAKDIAALGLKVGGGTGYLRSSDLQRHFRDAQAGALMAYSVEVCQAAIGGRLLG